MDWTRLILILLSIPCAWAFGRSTLRWALYVYFGGYVVLILLFLLKKKPPKMPIIPKWFLDWYNNKYVDKQINHMEKQFDK